MKDERSDGGAGSLGVSDHGDKILVPVAAGASVEQSSYLATALASDGAGEIVFLEVTLGGREAPLPDADGSADLERKAARRAFDATTASRGDVSVTSLAETGRSLSDVVPRVVEEHRISTVVLQDSPGSPIGGEFSVNDVEKLGRRTDADVVVANGRGRLDEASSILVPIARGPHSGVAVDVAKTLAVRNDVWMDLLHVVPADPTRSRRNEASDLLEAAASRVEGFERVDSWTLEADDVATAIVEQESYYDTIVLGAPTKSRLQRFVGGFTSETVRNTVETSLVVTRSREKQSWRSQLLDD